jgi:hypothetical protein
MKKNLLPVMLATACVLAQSSLAEAQSVLIDFGNDSTFRGVTSPGNWNSVAFGFFANLKNSDGNSTTIDWAPDSLGDTDSFNSIAGATTNPVTAGEIATADAAINKTTLGVLGVAQAAIDFFKSNNGVTSVGRFQLQQVSPGQLYDLTFYGTRQFVAAGNEQTRYSVFSDSSYSTLLGSTTLNTGTTNGTGNPGNTATISNLVGPSNANNIFYIQWEGVNDSTQGYINSMSITAVPEPTSIALFGLGALCLGTFALRRKSGKI